MKAITPNHVMDLSDFELEALMDDMMEFLETASVGTKDFTTAENNVMVVFTEIRKR